MSGVLWMSYLLDFLILNSQKKSAKEVILFQTHFVLIVCSCILGDFSSNVLTKFVLIKKKCTACIDAPWRQGSLLQENVMTQSIDIYSGLAVVS